MGQAVAAWLIPPHEEAWPMTRTFLFLSGFAIAWFALPAALDHHARAEFMQLAWCTTSGEAFSGSVLHCPACPALLLGAAMMLLGVFLPWFARFAPVLKGSTR
jgi:hypothetical protein